MSLPHQTSEQELIMHLYECVCVYTQVILKKKKLYYRYLQLATIVSALSTLLRSLFFACITRWQPDYKWVRLINNVFTKSGLFVYSFVCVLRALLMESLPRDLSRWNVGWWWDESIFVRVRIVLFFFLPPQPGSSSSDYYLPSLCSIIITELLICSTTPKQWMDD